MDYITSYLKLFPDLNSEEVTFIKSYLTIGSYAKKEFLFKSGKIQKEIGFVCEGLLRRYYINDKGNKICTKTIYINNKNIENPLENINFKPYNIYPIYQQCACAIVVCKKNKANLYEIKTCYFLKTEGSICGVFVKK
jgi:hypothetical protein